VPVHPGRGFAFGKQARQDSNLQPPAWEPTPSNAGVAAFGDFQGLSSEGASPALPDNAGVDTIPNIRDAIREYLAAREGLLKGAVVREVDVAS
jgi:hypothetical protein